jgi:hypothetical protein
VTTSEIGATRRSHAYAVKPTSEPATTRYSQAAIESAASAPPPRSRHSPAASAATTRKTPPASISYALATKGSRGRVRRGERKEPIDQETDAATMTRRPTAVEPAPRPGAITSPSPTSPASVLSRVARAGLSPAASRSRITCSGTVPAIIAATLESILVSATCTTPTPRVRRSKPTAAVESSSRRVTLKLRPRAASSAVRISPAAKKRDPAVSSGGSVSTAILIAKYVEPQTK